MPIATGPNEAAGAAASAAAAVIQAAECAVRGKIRVRDRTRARDRGRARVRARDRTKVSKVNAPVAAEAAINALPVRPSNGARGTITKAANVKASDVSDRNAPIRPLPKAAAATKARLHPRP